MLSMSFGGRRSADRSQGQQSGVLARRRRRGWARLLRLFDQLESRCLLSTIIWGNAAGGNWNTGSNWVGGVVPGVNDDAVIPNSFGSITVTYSSSTSEIHSLTNDETLQISGGSFQIDAALTANNITQSGGTFTGGGDLTVSGVYAWSGGTQSGTGSTILASGVQMNITNAVTAGRAIDDTASGAAINWNSASLSGTLNNPGQLNINTSSSYVSLYGTLNNTGTITWAAARVPVLLLRRDAQQPERWYGR